MAQGCPVERKEVRTRGALETRGGTRRHYNNVCIYSFMHRYTGDIASPVYTGNVDIHISPHEHIEPNYS